MPWYKGNIHCHSTNSDGTESPQKVAEYYKKLKYDFIGISDHNQYTSVDSYAKQAGILGIPCCEYTGKHFCHVLAAGVTRSIAPNLDHKDIWERMAPDKLTSAKIESNPYAEKVLILQDGINKTRQAGGLPIICHPLWKWSFNHQEIAELDHCTHFEIFNAGPDCNSAPLPGKSYMDEMWDALLSGNIRIIGLAADDAHIYKTPYSARLSFGGKAWNMVKAKSLTQHDILYAIKQGQCYATTGILLADYTVSKDKISVTVHVQNREKTCIQFFGMGGRILQSQYATTSEYHFDGSETYVRCRISSTAGLWAWMQPVFMDNIHRAIDWTNRE